MVGLTPPLKYFGGKHYLAKRIVALMPRHLHYVEPYAGGLAVLLERDPNDKKLWLTEKGSGAGVSEVVNDLNGRLMNFWRVLQDPVAFVKFQRNLEATSLAREEFKWAQAASTVMHQTVAHMMRGQVSSISDALAFFIYCRQSRAGTFKGFTSLTRSRTRRGINGNASEWLGAIDGLPAVHARLRSVVVENMLAIKLIRREDTKNTLFYADPPYFHPTRATRDAYEFEMTKQDHIELLDTLCQCKGKVMLSGYPSNLYNNRLRSWNRHTFDMPNHAAGGKNKRRMQEILWINY